MKVFKIFKKNKKDKNEVTTKKESCKNCIHFSIVQNFSHWESYICKFKDTEGEAWDLSKICPKFKKKDQSKDNIDQIII